MPRQVLFLTIECLSENRNLVQVFRLPVVPDRPLDKQQVTEPSSDATGEAGSGPLLNHAFPVDAAIHRRHDGACLRRALTDGLE